MKYKVGDKVKLAEKTTAYTSEKMERLLGKVVTITYVGESYYSFKEDGGEWRWDDRSIEGLAPSEEETALRKIVITSDGKETLARLHDGKKVIASATAKCSPDDEFDFNIGAKLAFERLMEDEDRWRVVDRPARVGDYIRLKTSGGFSFSKPGDILKVCKAARGYVRVLGKDHLRDTHFPYRTWKYLDIEYEVVERVGEKKVEKPEYYNGKVVCVMSEDDSYTVGKVYEFKDGTLVDDQGAVRYRGDLRVKHPDEIVCIYKFIPFIE